MKRHRRLNTSASLLALSAAIFAAGQVQAQTNNDNSTVDEIVVTGIRASLERSIEIKRNNSGVVDAISAEDIGKFPDTNLAESLQRITGVSIDRTNGEGSQVTVRGFGGGFNLVTVNGRTMPTANVSTVGGDQSSTSPPAPAARSTSRTWPRKASRRWKSTRPAGRRSRRAASARRSTSRPATRSTRARAACRQHRRQGVYDTSMDKKLEAAPR
jgi:hypothetical protein